MTRGTGPAVVSTIHASHLRRGFVDDSRWALGIETNHQLPLLVGQWQKGARDTLAARMPANRSSLLAN